MDLGLKSGYWTSKRATFARRAKAYAFDVNNQDVNSILYLFRWFHVMCAVENNTIQLAKLRDIKHNAMCLEHSLPQKSTPKKQKVDVFQSEGSNGSESESDTDSQPSSKKPAANGHTLKRPNSSNEGYPRKYVKTNPNGLPPKPVQTPKNSSAGSRSPIPTSALHWLMDKAKIIQEASLAIENMPSDYKSLFCSCRIIE
jgi:hypothetical protein